MAGETLDEYLESLESTFTEQIQQKHRPSTSQEEVVDQRLRSRGQRGAPIPTDCHGSSHVVSFGDRGGSGPRNTAPGISTTGLIRRHVEGRFYVRDLRRWQAFETGDHSNPTMGWAENSAARKEPSPAATGSRSHAKVWQGSPPAREPELSASPRRKRLKLGSGGDLPESSQSRSNVSFVEHPSISNDCSNAGHRLQLSGRNSPAAEEATQDDPTKGSRNRARSPRASAVSGRLLMKAIDGTSAEPRDPLEQHSQARLTMVVPPSGVRQMTHSPVPLLRGRRLSRSNSYPCNVRPSTINRTADDMLQACSGQGQSRAQQRRQMATKPTPQALHCALPVRSLQAVYRDAGPLTRRGSPRIPLSGASAPAQLIFALSQVDWADVHAVQAVSVLLSSHPWSLVRTRSPWSRGNEYMWDWNCGRDAGCALQVVSDVRNGCNAVVFCSNAFKAQTGYSAEEIMGNSWYR
eukprot:scaffold1699_cov390-Prasinococcus_capsulatus_cf.AAC.3